MTVCRSRWVKPGGDPSSFFQIFFQLRNFPTLERVTNEFKQAMYSVMVIFCEVRRLRSLSLEISHRIDNQLPPMNLSEFHLEIMRQWGTASGIVLEANKQKTLQLGHKLPEWWFKKVHLERLKLFSCLIGAKGELLLLKFNRDYVRENDKDFNFEKLLADPRSAMVPDWEFITYE